MSPSLDAIDRDHQIVAGRHVAERVGTPARLARAVRMRPRIHAVRRSRPDSRPETSGRSRPDRSVSPGAATVPDTRADLVGKGHDHAGDVRVFDFERRVEHIAPANHGRLQLPACRRRRRSGNTCRAHSPSS